MDKGNYVVKCNGVKYTMPLSLEAAEKYCKLRQNDKKPNGRDPTHGGTLKWTVEEV